MSVHANKALYYRFATSIRRARGALDETVSPAFLDHSLPVGTTTGLAGLERFDELVRKACPLPKITIEDLIAESDRVVGRVRVQCTAASDAPGDKLGQAGAIELIEIVRIAEGRIAERWCQIDPTSLVQLLRTTSAR